MAKKKDSEALFEIIARTRASQDPAAINVPEWMSKKPPQQEAEAGVEPGQEPKAEQAPPKLLLKSEPTGSRQFQMPPSLLAIRDWRVTVSLNFVSCAVLGLALLTLLLSMLVIGWKWGAASAPGPSEVPLYNPGVMGKKDPGDITPKPAAPQREVGKFYMLIQGVEGITERHKAEAQRIVDFCNEANLPADIGQMRDPNQYIVWSLTGFDSPDNPEAKEYAEQIKELGKQYKAKYRTYELRQAYPGGAWPWFHEYRLRR
ncbi:hypothetical protein ES707_06909 [subsurface metagenome]